MKDFMWNIFLVFYTCSYTCSGAVNTDGKGTFIVGGAEAEEGQFPYVGSIRNAQGDHICGATLVHPVWAVTSAHCQGDADYTIVWGAVNSNNGTEIGMLERTRHPDFNEPPGFSSNDIAVILLEEPVDNIPNVAPIAIAQQEVEQGQGVIAGWGRECVNCTLSENLLYGETLLLSNTECASAWEDLFYPPAHLCVLDPEAVVTSCNGDGGSPLVIEVGGEPQLHGVVSWGATGCVPDTPAVNARVSTYFNWICSATDGEALGC